jgi:hypothetical protein
MSGRVPFFSLSYVQIGLYFRLCLMGLFPFFSLNHVEIGLNLRLCLMGLFYTCELHVMITGFFSIRNQIYAM